MQMRSAFIGKVKDHLLEQDYKINIDIIKESIPRYQVGMEEVNLTNVQVEDFKQKYGITVIATNVSEELQKIKVFQ